MKKKKPLTMHMHNKESKSIYYMPHHILPPAKIGIDEMFEKKKKI